MGRDVNPADFEKPEVNMVMHDLTPRRMAVRETRRLSRSMQRVVFGGEDLAGFIYVRMAPDDHVKLFFEHADGRIVMPTIGPKGWQQPENGELPIYRDYTVRAFDPSKRELTIDFVLHGHGVAGAWAAGARPGDELGLLGPRGSQIYPTGYDWYLLAADETALPALDRWLEELPADRKVIAFVEVTDIADEVVLTTRENAEITYLHRGSTPAGASDVLYRAIRDLEFPTGEGFVWAAGEANSLKPIRRHLRRERGLDKRQVKVDGYWRQGAVNLDHHTTDDE